jgi:hypothetical protein
VRCELDREIVLCTGDKVWKKGEKKERKEGRKEGRDSYEGYRNDEEEVRYMLGQLRVRRVVAQGRRRIPTFQKSSQIFCK